MQLICRHRDIVMTHNVRLRAQTAETLRNMNHMAIGLKTDGNPQIYEWSDG